MNHISKHYTRPKLAKYTMTTQTLHLHFVELRCLKHTCVKQCKAKKYWGKTILSPQYLEKYAPIAPRESAPMSEISTCTHTLLQWPFSMWTWGSAIDPWFSIFIWRSPSLVLSSSISRSSCLQFKAKHICTTL